MLPRNSLRYWNNENVLFYSFKDNTYKKTRNWVSKDKVTKNDIEELNKKLDLIILGINEIKNIIKNPYL